MKKIVLVLTVIALTCSILFAVTACNKVKMSYDPSTDYGIYWFGDDNFDFVRSGKNMDKKYFDPSKPTFVFAHGWEPDEENCPNGLFEDFVTHADTIAKTGTKDVRDYAKTLKEQGYNVCCLSWFSYANVSFGKLGKLFGYIWLELNGGYALSTRFAMELALTLGEDYKGDVRIVGHSYGSQLALATTYQLIKLQEKKAFKNNHIIPTRMTLADPYFGKAELISGWNSKNVKNSKLSFTNEPLKERAPSALFADITDYVVSKKDIAVDMYFGMGIASSSYYKYDGSDANFEKLIKNTTVIKSEGMKEAYMDNNIHNVVRDWTLLSIVDKVLLYDQNGDVAPSGAATNSQIKSMRGKCYNQVYRGFDLSKDSMELVDRATQEF